MRIYTSLAKHRWNSLLPELHVAAEEESRTSVIQLLPWEGLQDVDHVDKI